MGALIMELWTKYMDINNKIQHIQMLCMLSIFRRQRKISKYEKLKNQIKSESEILFYEKKIKEMNTIIEILS